MHYFSIKWLKRAVLFGVLCVGQPNMLMPSCSQNSFSLSCAAYFGGTVLSGLASRKASTYLASPMFDAALLSAGAGILGFVHGRRELNGPSYLLHASLLGAGATIAAVGGYGLWVRTNERRLNEPRQVDLVAVVPDEQALNQGVIDGLQERLLRQERLAVGAMGPHLWDEPTDVTEERVRLVGLAYRAEQSQLVLERNRMIQWRQKLREAEAKNKAAWHAQQQEWRRRLGLLHGVLDELGVIGPKCAVCHDVRPYGDFVILDCGHDSVCRGCMLATIQNAFDARNSRIACTEPGCGKELTSNDISYIEKDRVKAQEIVCRKHDIMLEQFLTADKNSVPCPTPDCKVVFSRIDDRPGLICCEGCHHEYCIQCSLKHSDPVSCAEAKENLHLGEDTKKAESDTELWKQQNTKKCPKCQVAVESAGGCNHMLCKPPCGTHFCYRCNKELAGPYYKSTDVETGTLVCGCPLYSRAASSGQR